MHRHAGRHDQLVDAGDALLGVDEQPFPVERDDLRRRAAARLRRRAACAGSSSCEPIQATPPSRMIDQHRDRPDDELDAAGERPVGQVARPRVRSAEPPGEGERRDDRRHDDRQHDRQRVEQDRALGAADRPAGSSTPPQPASERREQRCQPSRGRLRRSREPGPEEARARRRGVGRSHGAPFGIAFIRVDRHWRGLASGRHHRHDCGQPACAGRAGIAVARWHCCARRRGADARLGDTGCFPWACWTRWSLR